MVSSLTFCCAPEIFESCTNSVAAVPNAQASWRCAWSAIGARKLTAPGDRGSTTSRRSSFLSSDAAQPAPLIEEGLLDELAEPAKAGVDVSSRSASSAAGSPSPTPTTPTCIGLSHRFDAGGGGRPATTAG